MKYFSLQKRKRGVSLIEVVVGASIISIAFISTMAVYNLYLKTALRNTSNIRATLILEEGLETVKLLRDQGWTTKIAALTPGTAYYLTWNGSMWQTTVTKTLVDGIFERKLVFSNVYRDANDDIAASGTLSVGTKKVTVTVIWPDGNTTTSKSAETYITNLLNN